MRAKKTITTQEESNENEGCAVQKARVGMRSLETRVGALVLTEAPGGAAGAVASKQDLAQTRMNPHNPRAPGAHAERRLVVDVLNYLWFFVPITRDGSADPWALFCEMRRRVKSFHAACLSLRLAPFYVLDCGSASSEAGAKWRMRRAQEVEDEYKAMPYAVDTALAAALREHTKDVIQAPNCDADDVIMALAAHFGGDVLSADRDMLRYTDVDWTLTKLYTKFRMQKRCAMALSPSNYVASAASPRLARTLVLQLDEWRMPQMKRISQMITAGRLLRGNTDSFTKAMGNLNIVTRPLRQALYARIGLDAVQEDIPVWNAELQVVSWNNDLVPADATLDALLCDPEKAFAWVVQQDDAAAPLIAKSKRKRLQEQNGQHWRSYARAMIVAEYCVDAQCIAGAKLGTDELFALAQSLDPFCMPGQGMVKTRAKQGSVSARVLRP